MGITGVPTGDMRGSSIAAGGQPFLRTSVQAQRPSKPPTGHFTSLQNLTGQFPSPSCSVSYHCVVDSPRILQNSIFIPPPWPLQLPGT